MIITLVKADFSAKNIGTLSSFAVLTNILNATYSGPTSVEKDGAFTATITMHDGYSLPETGVAVSMGGVTLTDAYSVSGDVITLSIAAVTGVIVINMAGVVLEGERVVFTETLTYTSRQSNSTISKTTGEYGSSSAGYVNIYENIDPTATYLATSYAPDASGNYACVAYFDADGIFISAESGSDWGISSTEYTDQQLTVPSNTSTIQMFGRTSNQTAVLQIVTEIILQEISYSSQKTASNLNETTGEYGSSTAGYVNIYDGIDATKTYYASGFCPNASGTAASICYYTSDGTFISAQDGNDFGLSSANFEMKKLTVPSNASTIKVFAQSTEGFTAAALYVVV